MQRAGIVNVYGMCYGYVRYEFRMQSDYTLCSTCGRVAYTHSRAHAHTHTHIQLYTSQALTWSHIIGIVRYAAINTMENAGCSICLDTRAASSLLPVTM